jgi:TPR repeat protein
MNDKHALQHMPNLGNDLSVRPGVSDDLVARGRSEAARLMTELPQKPGKDQIDEADMDLLRGTLYYHGQGVPQDFERAAMWFRKAADKGVAEAQYYLGLQHDDGQGVIHSHVRAAAWYQMAAKQGYAPAQNNLGLLYELGEGVPKSFSLAEMWFRKAAEQGQAGAQAWLGDNYYYGRGVPKDYGQAYFWLYLATTNRERSIQDKHATAREAAAAKLTSKEALEQEKFAQQWLLEHPPKEN